MPEIEGYKVILLRLTATGSCHSVYAREHFIRLPDPTKPKGRTLFLLNIPPYVLEKHLRNFFNTIGIVQSVSFAEKPGKDETSKWRQHCTQFSNISAPFKFKVGYVVFKNSSSLKHALQLNSIDLYSKDTGEPTVVTGMQLWHSDYKKQILKEDEELKRIEKFMAAYDQRERAAQEAAKTTEADPDGWVTVGKKGHGAGFEQNESVIGKLEEKVVRGKKKKELTNFYTFQIRESNMRNVIELRKKFEEDKRKIETLKKTRRFRPF